MSKHLDNFNEQNPDHHKNEVMKMQVHHLVSKASMKEGIIRSISKKLKDKGYDIDDIDNLVALPNDYQGACHLEVQLHRSNHRNATTSPEGHPINYHKYVAKIILKEFDHIDFNNYCGSTKLQAKMNKLSKRILKEINDFNISLTEKEISDNFETGNPTGCRDLELGNGIAIFREHQEKGKTCKMSNRSGKHGQHFVNIKKYTLKTGY